MSEREKVGMVFSYFAKPMVAAVKLSDGGLKVGDKIQIQGGDNRPYFCFGLHAD
jgi:hypothetical protein